MVFLSSLQRAEDVLRCLSGLLPGLRHLLSLRWSSSLRPVRFRIRILHDDLRQPPSLRLCLPVGLSEQPDVLGGSRILFPPRGGSDVAE